MTLRIGFSSNLVSHKLYYSQKFTNFKCSIGFKDKIYLEIKRKKKVLVCFKYGATTV